MPTGPFDIASNQLESAAKNKARAAEADVRRQTSIVQQANRIIGSMAQERPDQKRPVKSKKSGVYVGDGPAFVIKPAADGYVRKTPVQQLKVDPKYRSRLIKRVVAIILGVLIAGVVLYVLLTFITSH